MSNLNLKNLKKQALSITQQKKINGGFGGYMCSMYYCQHINPNASCCCTD